MLGERGSLNKLQEIFNFSICQENEVIIFFNFLTSMYSFKYFFFLYSFKLQLIDEIFGLVSYLLYWLCTAG